MQQITVNNLKYNLDMATDTAICVGPNSLSVEVASIVSEITYFLTKYKVIGIGDLAFKNSNITTITIPSTITNIGFMAFDNCQKLGQIVIPDSVTIIGDYAFNNCDSLTRVTIPDSVTTIGNSVFHDCDSLTSVTIGNGVTEIGDYAFYDCSSLTSIIIPDNMESIGKGAFQNCSNLKSVKLTNAAVFISANAFLGCHSSLYRDYQYGKYIGSAENPYAILIGVTNKFLEAYNIHPQTRIIAESAFEQCELKEINIHNNIIVIGERAFYQCTNLVSITMPSYSTIKKIGFCAFYNCINLTNIIIPSSVISIGKFAFNNCINLVEVIIQSGVGEIGSYAFESCNSLTNIIIPASITKIDSNAFFECASLTIYCEVESKPQDWSPGWNTLPCPVVWDYNNNDIADDGNIYTVINGIRYALQSNYAMVARQPNNTIITDIPLSITYTDIIYSVTSIQQEAFKDCKQLTNINISNNVRNIGSNAFENCSQLKTAHLPKLAKDYNEWFKLCVQLQSITVDSNNKVFQSINGNLYTSDTILQYSIGKTDNNFSLPLGKSKIKKYAFYGNKLEEIKFPTLITYIGEKAFSGSTPNLNLTMTIPVSPNAEIHSTAFNGLKNVNLDLRTTPAEAELALQNYPYGAQSININFPNLIKDLDFLGFTFNGLHSFYDLNVYRTSGGKLYEEKLSPEITDITAQNTSTGQFYFGSVHKSQKFLISFAFDNLTEAQLRKWKQFCAGLELGDLIFDEKPYKVYSAKITGKPALNYISFNDESGKRIYKGEGTLEFTAYWPYAHTPDSETKISTFFTNTGKFNKDGTVLGNYPDYLYNTKDEWSIASGLSNTENTHTGENPGDVSAYFTVTGTCNMPFKLVIGDCYVECNGCDTTEIMTWDSKTGLVYTDTKKILETKGKTYGNIPVGGTQLIEIYFKNGDEWLLAYKIEDQTWVQKNSEIFSGLPEQPDCTINYHYWYY